MFEGTRCQAWGVVRADAHFLESMVPALGKSECPRTSVDQRNVLVVRQSAGDSTCRQPRPEPGQQLSQLPPRLQSTNPPFVAGLNDRKSLETKKSI
jgi:hypothetical protein